MAKTGFEKLLLEKSASCNCPLGLLEKRALSFVELAIGFLTVFLQMNRTMRVSLFSLLMGCEVQGLVMRPILGRPALARRSSPVAKMLDFSVVDLQTTIGEHLTQPSWDLATPLDLPSWLLSEAAGAVEKVDTGWFGTGKEEIARSLT